MRDEPRAHRHPSLDDVQRYVDAALDPTRDAALVAHVSACPTCAAHVERLRAVTAALALASAPPVDLLERIRARRRANEHVILPTAGHERIGATDAAPPDGGHPRHEELQAYADDALDAEREGALDAHLAGCAACRRELAAVRRVTDLLALSSAPPPPDDLLARIAARRAAGERVVLPVPDGVSDGVSDGVFDGAPVDDLAARRARHDGARRRGWRWAVAASGLPAAAAAALLAVRVLQTPAGQAIATGPSVAPPPTASAPASARRTPAAAPTAPTVVAVAPAPRAETFRGVRPAPDSAVAAAPDSAADAAIVGATVAARGDGQEPAVALVVLAAGLDAAQLAALDSVAAVASADATRRVVIRYAAPSASFMDLAVERLLVGGVAQERIVPHRVAAVGTAGLPAGRRAIEVVVVRVGGSSRE